MISLRDVVTGFGNRDPLAEVWRRSLRGGGGGSAEITGTLPLRYIGNGKPLTYYMIYGNTVQNGTPSPKAPVDVMGCGVWDETRQSYKLPPTVNGTEYPIYLGEVESTRRIKKLVLTGEENWRVNPTPPDSHNVMNIIVNGALRGISPICTHYIGSTAYQWVTVAEGHITTSIQSGNYIRLAINVGTESLDDFVSYLAQQYANGTPVTVWYVLATPETGVINEPLHKIGDYADSVNYTQAGVTIPTVSGTNILDTTSTVKPSEVYIKGKGIKPTGYGQLVDKNGVRILDKNNVRILVHGQ